jgi:formaldehyde-activating enzyme involved in methanogenesis
VKNHSFCEGFGVIQSVVAKAVDKRQENVIDNTKMELNLLAMQ